MVIEEIIGSLGVQYRPAEVGTWKEALKVSM